jgi:hypothetical protein
MHDFLKGAAVGGIGAALVLVGSSALAGTGIGGVFNLGQSNTVNQPSVLSGTTPGDQLGVVNNSTASNATAGNFLGKSTTAPALRVFNSGGGPALTMNVASGKPPFSTNSAYRVVNLNADRLDGVDSTGFLRNLAPSTLTGAVASPGSVFTAQNTGTGDGLAGKTGSSSAAAVRGTNTGSGVGVYGSSASGKAGYFQGSVTVNGAETVSGGITTNDFFCLGCLKAVTFGQPDPYVDLSTTTADCPNTDSFDVSAPGHFCTGWENYPTGNYETVGYYLDPWGIVHLKGLVRYVAATGSNATIMELPSYYCGWNHDKIFSAIASSELLARIDVALHVVTGNFVNGCEISVHNGATLGNDYLSLDGITWSVNQKNIGDTAPPVAKKRP